MAQPRKPIEPPADDGWRISDALWERLALLIPPGKAHPLGCHNPRVPDRAALDGILFVLRTGCQWEALNYTGICKKSPAHRRFQEWPAAGVFAQLWAAALQEYEELHGIEWRWQAMDGALTKAPLGGKKTGKNPTDRAKQGVKRSLLTDGRGTPLGIAVAGANVPDYQLTEETLESVPISRPDPRVPSTPAAPEAGQPQGLCLDAGHFYEEVYEILDRWGYTAHIGPRGSGSGVRELTPEERREAGIEARRWVVERTHSWLNRFRGLLIRWCKKPENYLALLHFACALITHRVTVLLG